MNNCYVTDTPYGSLQVVLRSGTEADVHHYGRFCKEGVDYLLLLHFLLKDNLWEIQPYSALLCDDGKMQVSDTDRNFIHELARNILIETATPDRLVEADKGSL